MDLFNTIENKARFYGMKIDLMWKNIRPFYECA